MCTIYFVEEKDGVRFILYMYACSIHNNITEIMIYSFCTIIIIVPNENAFNYAQFF